MTILQFEQFPDYLRSAELEWRLRAHTDYGPTMRDGRQQRVSSSAGHWVAEARYDVSSLAEIREFQAIAAKGAGGVTEFVVPTRFRLQAPWPAGFDAAAELAAVQIASGRTLANGRVLARRVIDIKVVGAIAAGATVVRARVFRAGTLRRGQWFTVPDSTGRKRLHVVTEIPRLVSPAVYDLTILPPLRGALRNNTQMDWENPASTMVFADPDTGGLRLKSYFQASPTILWRESFHGL